MSYGFAANATIDYNPDPTVNVFDSLLGQYKKVLITSAVNSFELMTLFQDVKAYIKQKYNVTIPSEIDCSFESKVAEISERYSFENNFENEVDMNDCPIQSDVEASDLSERTYSSFIVEAVKVLHIKLDIKQAIGLIGFELIEVIVEQLKLFPNNLELGEMLKKLANVIKEEIPKIVEKYKEIVSETIFDMVKKIMAKFSMSLAKIFKKLGLDNIKIIQKIWALLCNVCKILFFNDEQLELEERLRRVALAVASGGSAIVGSVINAAVSKVPLAQIPIVGPCLPLFLENLSSGILACTLIFFINQGGIDKMVSFFVGLSQKGAEFLQEIQSVGFAAVQNIFSSGGSFFDIENLKKFGLLKDIHTIDTEAHYYEEVLNYFEKYAAALEKIDFEAFQNQCRLYGELADGIESCKTEEELNTLLREIMKQLDIACPWGEGSFDDFMRDKSRCLVFE